VRAASLNPGAEVVSAHAAERQQRRESQRQSDDARRTAANNAVGGVSQPTLGNDALKIPEPAKAQP
jgi:hypothetical protein